MLLDVGVNMRAMRGDDWDFIVSLCDESVMQQYALRGQPGTAFSALQLGLRARMDQYLAGYIQNNWGEADEFPLLCEEVANGGDGGKGGGVERVVRLSLTPKEPPSGKDEGVTLTMSEAVDSGVELSLMRGTPVRVRLAHRGYKAIRKERSSAGCCSSEAGAEAGAEAGRTGERADGRALTDSDLQQPRDTSNGVPVGEA